eukprot:11903914-Prorocentrum_lima.AAC.1
MEAQLPSAAEHLEATDNRHSGCFCGGWSSSWRKSGGCDRLGGRLGKGGRSGIVLVWLLSSGEVAPGTFSSNEDRSPQRPRAL